MILIVKAMTTGSYRTVGENLGRATILRGRNLLKIEQLAYYPEIIDIEDTMGKEKKVNNIVVIGPPDSGKSTIIAHLLDKLSIDKRQLERLEKLENGAFKMKKRSFKYAWVLDKLRDERERGITVDISLWKFETTQYCFTVIDTPGHRNFIKNMITGTSQADCAVLIIDSRRFGPGWSEQALLAFTLGVRQMICCCNMMDVTTPKYSNSRYNEVVEEVSSYLKEVGYDPNNVTFVPISGFEGDNMIKRSTNLNWYSGPTLLEALDKINEPMRPSDKPLRLPLDGVYTFRDIGKVPYGRVETGVIKPGTVVTFAPTGLSTEVEAVKTMDFKLVPEALPGVRVYFNINNIATVKNLKCGYVASDPNNNPAKGASSFTALVIILMDPEPPAQICNGYTPVLDYHTSHMAVQFSKIQTKIDGNTGIVIERQPELLKKGDVGMVKMIPTEPMVVETFSEYPPLGCFDVKDMMRTVAVGVIMSLDKDPSDAKEGSKAATKKKGAK